MTPRNPILPGRKPPAQEVADYHRAVARFDRNVAAAKKRWESTEPEISVDQWRAAMTGQPWGPSRETWAGRLRCRFALVRNRCRNAWLALRGED